MDKPTDTAKQLEAIAAKLDKLASQQELWSRQARLKADRSYAAGKAAAYYDSARRILNAKQDQHD